MRDYTRFEDMNIGSTYETDILVVSIEDRISFKSGKKYAVIRFSDGKEVIGGVMFDASVENLGRDNINIGTVVKATINVGTFNDEINYIVCSLYPVQCTNEYRKKFAVTAPIDVEKTFRDLLDLLAYNSDLEVDGISSISDLTREVLTLFKAPFIKSAAGKSLHHACIGGLLQHSYNVALDAAKYCDIHPELDRELIVCGAALHDIGKIRSLRTSPYGFATDTIEGKLIGHSALGVILIEECIATLLKFYNPDRVAQLEHLVAAHHYSKIKGAISDALLPEAIVLHSLDAMDAKMNTTEQKNVKEIAAA